MRTPRRLLSQPLLNATTRNGRRYASSAPQFDWQDPLASKTLLTEDELAIADTAERYCQEELAPRVLRTAHTNPILNMNTSDGLIRANRGIPR